MFDVAVEGCGAVEVACPSDRPMLGRGSPAPALAAGALAALLRPAASQICNSADPESGGLWIPAFGTGGAKVRRRGLAVPRAVLGPAPPS